jgi:hypothetical protein
MCHAEIAETVEIEFEVYFGEIRERSCQPLDTLGNSSGCLALFVQFDLARLAKQLLELRQQVVDVTRRANRLLCVRLTDDVAETRIGTAVG